MPGKGFKLLDAYVEVHGDADGAVKEAVNQIDNDGGRARASGLQFGKRLVAGIIGSIVVAKIGSYLGEAIGLGSDLNETISKSNVIFGVNAQMMRNWAENAAVSMGLSQSSALAAAAGFGDMFTQLGFSGDAAAEMSQQVVQAAADLGSFSNLDTADVADRMSAAFRGEYDSLQALIPNINAARVEQEAMAATGKTNASELTAQEKAAATLAIVMKDGSRAMGDFERTGNGWANQMKIARAQSDDLKASIGEALLPGLTALAGVVTGQVMPGLQLLADKYLPSVSEWMERVAEKIGGLDLLDFNNGVVTLGSSWDGLIEKIQPFIDIAKALLPVVFSIHDALAPLGAIVSTGLAPAIDVLSVAVGGALVKAMESLQPVLPLVVQAAVELLNAVVPLIPKILELVPPLLDLVPPILDLVTSVLPPLVDLLGIILPPLIDILTYGLGNLTKILVWVVENWQGFFDGLKNVADFMNGDVSAAEFTERTEKIGGAFGWVLSVVQPWVEEMGTALGRVITFLTPLLTTAQNVFGGIYNAMAYLFSWWLAYVWPIVTGLADLFGAVFGLIQRIVSSGVGAVVGVIQGVWGGLVGIVSGIFNNVMNSGIGGPLRGGLGHFHDFFSNVVGFFSGAGGWLFDAGQNIIQGLLSGIQSMIGSVTSALRNLTNLIPQVKGPPARDRVLLRDNGRAIMQSLVDGFESKEPEIKAYLGDLTMALQTTAPGGAGYPVGFGSMDSDKGKASAPVYNFEAGAIVLDATNVKDFTDIVDMLKGVPQVARAGAGTPEGK